MPYPAEYSSKVFIPLPADEAVKTVIGDSYNPETALNVIKMFAGTDDLFAATIGLVKAVFQTGGIDPKAREIIILRSATILNVPYEWQANAKMPTNAGLSHDEIAAASAEGPVTGIDPEYVLLCKATDELSLTGTLTDETLTSMLRRYDEIIEVGDRYVQWCSKHLPVSPTVSGADRYQLRTVVAVRRPTTSNKKHRTGYTHFSDLGPEGFDVSVHNTTSRRNDPDGRGNEKDDGELVYRSTSRSTGPYSRRTEPQSLGAASAQTNTRHRFGGGSKPKSLGGRVAAPKHPS